MDSKVDPRHPFVPSISPWKHLQQLQEQLPFCLFIVTQNLEVYDNQGLRMEDPGACHNNTCSVCDLTDEECPIRESLRDGQRRRQHLPAHMCSGGKGMELDILPLGDAAGNSVLVLQRELENLEEELSRTHGSLERKIRQLDILNQVLASLQQHRDLDRILAILLTGITFGKGLEFNRAFFFERAGQEVRGRMAIGPLVGLEADAIWIRQDLREKSLTELLDHPAGMEAERPIQQRVEQIRFQLEGAGEQLRRALEQPGCTRISLEKRSPGGLCLLEETGSHQAWVAPVRLATEDDREDWRGFLLVDNSITSREPTSEHLDALVSCAHHLGFAIERARMNRELDGRLKELHEAYERLDRHQEQLVQAEKLAAVGRVSGNLIHELKTPLMSIGGFARLLEKELAGQGKASSHAGVVLKESRRIERVLDAMMDYSQPQVMRKEKVDLADRVRQAVTKMSEAFAEKSIRLELDIQDGHYTFSGDQLRLDQLLHAQMQNVLDLGEQNSAPTRLSLMLEPVPGGARLSLADDGPGVPEAMRDTLFEPFVSGREGTLGLGLAHAMDIARLHDGTMRLLQPGRLGGVEIETILSWRKHGEAAIRG